jgi:hypothetical protein
LGYSAVWKILDQMVEDLKKRRAEVPENVIDDLKSAKTLLRVHNANYASAETLEKIARHLENVEACLIFEAQKHFGDKYVNEWLRKIDAASREKTEDVEMHKQRFVPGVSREQKWIRVQPSKDSPNQALAELAGELGLSCLLQKDGHLLIYGTEEALKEFIKKMTSAQKRKSH